MATRSKRFCCEGVIHSYRNEFGAQLSILIIAPEKGGVNGFRSEVADARVTRAACDRKNAERYRVFREYDTRFAVAREMADKGEELTHRAPIRRIRAAFSKSIGKHGADSRVAIIKVGEKRISRQMIQEPDMDLATSTLMVGRCNWRRILEELTEFAPEAAQKIKRGGLLAGMQEASKFAVGSKERERRDFRGKPACAYAK